MKLQNCEDKENYLRSYWKKKMHYLQMNSNQIFDGRFSSIILIILDNRE